VSCHVFFGLSFFPPSAAHSTDSLTGLVVHRNKTNAGGILTFVFIFILFSFITGYSCMFVRWQGNILFLNLIFSLFFLYNMVIWGGFFVVVVEIAIVILVIVVDSVVVACCAGHGKPRNSMKLL